MSVEYWYITEDQVNKIGQDYGLWLNANPTKGKVIFKDMQDLKEGFSQHYPGCKIHSATEYN